MEFLPKRCHPKFKLFNLLSWTHEVFKITEHKGKIKFKKIWVYQNGGSPSNEANKILNF